MLGLEGVGWDERKPMQDEADRGTDYKNGDSVKRRRAASARKCNQATEGNS